MKATTPRNIIELLLSAEDLRRSMRIKVRIPIGIDGEASELIDVDLARFGTDFCKAAGLRLDVLELEPCDPLPHNTTLGEP